MPRILLAPDKFKGSLTASEVREAAELGLRRVFPEAELEFLHAPVADGGEGTMEAIRSALGGKTVSCAAHDPLGRPIEAEFALVEIDGESVAALEMSAASGFERVLDLPQDPLRASTCGTGEMILAAAEAGAARVLLGIGGSATNDGGSGMAQVLGYEFFDREGRLLGAPPLGLEKLGRIEAPDNLRLPEILVACDVDNPLLGERGATRIYGPQKGVGEEAVDLHEARLAALADAVERLAGLDLREGLGAGAAGGLGFGLQAFAGATLRPGFDLVAEITGLREQIEKADLVITGEGSLDAQTLSGKGPAGVAGLARAAGKPVLALCGITDASVPELGEAFDLILPLKREGVRSAEAMGRAAALIGERLEEAGEAIRGLV